MNFQHLTPAQRNALSAATKGGYSPTEANCIIHHSSTINGVQVVVLSVWAGRSECSKHHDDTSWQMVSIGTSTGFNTLVYEKQKSRQPTPGSWCSVYWTVDTNRGELTLEVKKQPSIYTFDELGIPLREEEHPPLQ